MDSRPRITNPGACPASGSSDLATRGPTCRASRTHSSSDWTSSTARPAPLMTSPLQACKCLLLSKCPIYHCDDLCCGYLGSLPPSPIGLSCGGTSGPHRPCCGSTSGLGPGPRCVIHHSSDTLCLATEHNANGSLGQDRCSVCPSIGNVETSCMRMISFPNAWTAKMCLSSG